MVKADIARDRVQELDNYIWSKYIELSSDAPEMDEEEALAIYAEYYREIPPASDEECYFYGILLFEMAFAQAPERQIEFLRKAKEIFYLYKAITGEEEWEEIDNRLEDIDGILAETDVNLVVPEDWIARLEGELTTPVGVVAPQDPSGVLVPPGMVHVPGGEFSFGLDGETVSVEPFFIDKHPVSNREYGRFIEESNYRPPRYWEDNRFNHPDQPVVGVSLGDAEQYAKWAGKRLPTEAEWELACRGTDRRERPWGEEPVAPERVNYTPDGEQHPAVGRRGERPGNISPCGAVDMVGLVWEWTSTGFPEHGDCNVVRGGSWADPDTYISCTSRLWGQRKDKENILGFRCVMDID